LGAATKKSAVDTYNPLNLLKPFTRFLGITK
jgi:hypothetical protein